MDPFWRDALGYRVCFSGESVVVLVPEDESNEVGRLGDLGAARQHDGIRSFGETHW
jgi:hypothetical protein